MRSSAIGCSALPLARTLAPGAESIIFDVRLPRVLTAMLVGGGLAVAGTVFQALLRNPMADPYIIGTAAGASLGAIAGLMAPILVPALAIGVGSSWLGLGLVQVLAFAGGLGTVLLVYAVSRANGRVPVVTLLLTGYAVSSVLAAGVALLMFFSGPAPGRHLRLADGLAGRRPSGSTWRSPHRCSSISSALLSSAGAASTSCCSATGQAGHLGVDVEREKLVLTMLATLATSTVGGHLGHHRLRRAGGAARAAPGDRARTIGCCCRPACCTAPRCWRWPTSARASPAGSRWGS